MKILFKEQNKRNLHSLKGNEIALELEKQKKMATNLSS